MIVAYADQNLAAFRVQEPTDCLQDHVFHLGILTSGADVPARSFLELKSLRLIHRDQVGNRTAGRRRWRPLGELLEPLANDLRYPTSPRSRKSSYARSYHAVGSACQWACRVKRSFATFELTNGQ